VLEFGASFRAKDTSQEGAVRNWKALAGDADFRAAFAATERDGKLVDKVESVYLNPADYSSRRALPSVFGP
jgi:hypothetical protein